MKFWITLIRGLFALILGVALLIQPDKARPILANFMGMYWLASGTVSLRFGDSGERSKGLTIFVAIIGVLAGIAMLSRGVTRNLYAEDVVISLLGVIVLLTGFIHAFHGFRERGTAARHRSWTSVFLGVFEMVLGLSLIFTPLDNSPVLYFAAAIWAFIGGAILIGDALSERARIQGPPPEESASKV